MSPAKQRHPFLNYDKEGSLSGDLQQPYWSNFIPTKEMSAHTAQVGFYWGFVVLPLWLLLRQAWSKGALTMVERSTAES